MAGTTSTIDLTSGSLSLSGLASTNYFTVNKTGAGTLTFTGNTANTNLVMNVNGGTVVLGKQGTVGAYALAGTNSIGSGATLQLTGNINEIDNNARVTVNSGGVLDMPSGQTENAHQSHAFRHRHQRLRRAHQQRCRVYLDHGG